VSVSSRIHNNTLTSSEIKPPSDGSTKRHYERALFIQRYEPNGTMMRRKREYEKPVEKSGLFFGNRQGSIDCSPSTSPAEPTKPMYPGNVSRRVADPSAKIPGQFLAPPPTSTSREQPYDQPPSPSLFSYHGTQAKSIKPSWYESGTAFLSKAATSCYTASKSRYDQATGWCKKGLALAGFRETAMHFALGSYIRDMTETKIAKMSIGATAMAESVRPGPHWTRCTGAASGSIYGGG
jgi:hypothetical protein